MEHRQDSALLGRFKGVIGEERLNEMGKRVGFCERLREVTPYRLAIAALSTLSCTTTETLADLHRGFTALFGARVAYKPFHNQLRKEEFPLFMRQVACDLIGKLAVKVLRVKQGAPFSEFSEIVIQDGSSFAVKDSLSRVFPGRFTSVSPAAVEVHASMNLLEGNVQEVTVTADTGGEREHLPDASTLEGKLLLADRGYFSLKYLGELNEEGASYIIRAKSSVNPVILSAMTADGKVLKRFHRKRLKEVSLSKQQPIDMKVKWDTKEGDVCCRLIVAWNPKHQVFNYFVTNLSLERYSIKDVLTAYRLRWQIELLFKEWKSYANLHSFDTSQAPIVQGMIWAALAAATIKRYLAHATQLVAGVEISTRKVAMCAVHVLLEVFVALVKKSPYRLLLAWRHAIKYFASQAKRAHPARDRKSGRLTVGLEPIGAAA